MRTTKLVVLGLGLAAACSSVNDKPKDAAAGDDATVVDAPIDAPVLPACANPVSGSKITMREIGRVNGAALLATSPPGDPRLFVIERGGAIRIFKNEQLTPTPFIDLSGTVTANGEQGLLGLAFHPRYAANGLFFVFYTTTTRNIVARCSVSSDPDVANPTCVPVLSIPDFAANHNGGMIEFGSDGYLYIGTGDGGQANDPHRNGQSLVDGSPQADSVALLAKILRIDVDNKASGQEYGIPSDNPFAAGGGAPEIFIIGVRNPWRWSFDRMTGDIWIGDVGQGELEELTVLRPAQQNGANLGWSMYEANSCFHAPCDPAGKIMPQDQHTHATRWISIIAGQTYRGSCYPDIVGWHFYSDYGRGGLMKARLLANDQLEVVDLTGTGTFPASPASLHADSRGELYLTTAPNQGNGRVLHLEAGP